MNRSKLFVYYIIYIMISNHILHGDSPVTKNFDNDELEFDYKNIARTIDNSIIYPKRKSIKWFIKFLSRSW